MGSVLKSLCGVSTVKALLFAAQAHTGQSPLHRQNLSVSTPGLKFVLLNSKTDSNLMCPIPRSK